MEHVDFADFDDESQSEKFSQKSTKAQNNEGVSLANDN